MDVVESTQYKNKWAASIFQDRQVQLNSETSVNVKIT